MALTEEQQKYIDFCIENKNDIFVRECIDGKWGSYSLMEIGPDKASQHVTRMWNEDTLAVTVNKGA